MRLSLLLPRSRLCRSRCMSRALPPGLCRPASSHAPMAVVSLSSPVRRAAPSPACSVHWRSCVARSCCFAARPFSADYTAPFHSPIALRPPTAPARRFDPRPSLGCWQAAYSPASSVRSSCNGRWMPGRPICLHSASSCRPPWRWWRWLFSPASTRQNLYRRTCIAAVRCSRSCDSRASWRRRSVA